MFIDFLTLMLINMAAGLAILAAYFTMGLMTRTRGNGLPHSRCRGFVALMCGFRVSWLWLLPGSYNAAYGDMSVLFGILFAGAAMALARGWKLFPVSIYAFFAGLAAVVTGVRFVQLHMT